MEKNCKNCKHFSVINGTEYYDDICIDCVRNEASYFEPKPQTNRQWLESLSDEEFSDYCWRNDLLITNIEWLQAEHKE